MTTVPEQSRSAIDRIGDRLRDGDFNPSVLEALDTFRSSHDRIVPVVLRAVGVNPGALTLRAAKSTASIVAKLRRESARLSQIQDIAGCRIIVPTIFDQAEMTEDRLDFVSAALALKPDQLLGYRILPSMGLKFKRSENSIEKLKPLITPKFYPVGPDAAVSTRVTGRLSQPQFGYRAVHVVVGYRSRFMEIQIRTQVQHAWAEVSEKAADRYGHEMKYGRGNQAVLDKLMRLSAIIAEFEDSEADYYFEDDEELELRRQRVLDFIKSEAFRI